jgi:hypothetical protein
MTRSTQVADLLNDLINADAGDNGLTLPPDTRPSLEDTLIRALLDPDRLKDHIQTLQKQLGTRFRHRELLDETTTEAVLHRGLTVLDDMALARLALNPIALAALAEEIEERQPAGWAEALRQDGMELLHAHNRTVPLLTDLLARAKLPDVQTPAGALNVAEESLQAKETSEATVIQRVRAAFNTGLAPIAALFSIHDLTIQEAVSTTDARVARPGVYVFIHPAHGVLRVGRHLCNAQFRVRGGSRRIGQFGLPRRVI